MKTFIAALICLLSITAHADSLYTGAWSYHFGDTYMETDEYFSDVSNSTHYLLAYERNNYIVGGFKNSFGDPTDLVGRKFNVFDAGGFEGSLYAGATYGYFACQKDLVEPDKQKARVCPALVPEVAYKRFAVQPAVIILGNAIALTIKWEI